jgi:hypothetical protein
MTESQDLNQRVEEPVSDEGYWSAARCFAQEAMGCRPDRLWNVLFAGQGADETFPLWAD